MKGISIRISDGTMKRMSILFVDVMALIPLMAATPSQARTIRVDATMTCSSAAAATSSLSVTLSGTGDKTNEAASGFNFPVLICADSLSAPEDESLTPLSYKPGSSLLYTWVDLSAAGLTPSSLTGPPGNENTPELSVFWPDMTIPIVAMVDVLKLTGSHSGEYEILFNYGTGNVQTGPENACDNAFKPIAPSFTWFGKTYEFTGAGGVGNPCEGKATNDFLFAADGALLGHNSAPDGSGKFTLTEGLPPGWAVK